MVITIGTRRFRPGRLIIWLLALLLAVISAAPAPTGWFGGCGPNGCDDAPWMVGLRNAGAAKLHTTIASTKSCPPVHKRRNRSFEKLRS